MAVNCDLMLYADDSVSGKDVKQIETLLSHNLESTSERLIDNKLSLHLGKTESILFDPKQKIKNADLSVTCKDEKIEHKQIVKYLGLVLDNSSRLQFI